MKDTIAMGILGIMFGWATALPVGEFLATRMATGKSQREAIAHGHAEMLTREDGSECFHWKEK